MRSRCYELNDMMQHRGARVRYQVDPMPDYDDRWILQRMWANEAGEYVDPRPVRAGSTVEIAEFLYAMMLALNDAEQ